MFLRETLGFKRRWIYYAAMIIDPILRFNWVFYAIFAHDIQHSTIVSFLVSIAEVLRRGMWSLFRVENEHCTNVGRFRASRDVPLPYDLPSPSTSNLSRSSDVSRQQQQPPSPTQLTPRRSHTTSTDLESASSGTAVPGSAAATLRQRRKSLVGSGDSPLSRTFNRVGTLLHAAHAQDFQRKKRPDVGKGDEEEEEEEAAGSSEEEEEEAEAEAEAEVEAEVEAGADEAARAAERGGVDRHGDDVAVGEDGLTAGEWGERDEVRDAESAPNASGHSGARGRDGA
ncbi:transcription-associated protein 1 [Elasticomyces elasticus]|nr:transcription-associated protein 1 [Elasticomyces elasticus]